MKVTPGVKDGLKRIITGAISIPTFVLLVLYTSVVWFLGLVLLTLLLALWEYYSMTLPSGDKGFKVFGIVLGGWVPLGVWWMGPQVIPWLLTLTVFLLFVYRLFYHPHLASLPSSIGISLLGVTYIGLLPSHLVLIRGLESGEGWVLFLFSVVWGNDAFAYWIGKGLGRHRLSPVVSPCKTIEGAVGGLLGGVFVALLFSHLFLQEVTLQEASLLAISLGVLSQLGDLFESLLKRASGVKDSGGIIPGHGGVLDRIDSAIAPIPFLYYYITLFRI